METLIKADIFFFISSIATIVLTILLSVVLYYFIRAGRVLYLLAEQLQEKFQDSEEFVLELKERLEGNPIFQFFFPLMRMRRKTAVKKEKKQS
ncbi:MAG: hypothetical protein WC823_05865 [Parcubacteria group bacterium]|jgi:hypothetical protein